MTQGKTPVRIIHFERNDETFSLGVAVGDRLDFRFAVANATGRDRSYCRRRSAMTGLR